MFIWLLYFGWPAGGGVGSSQSWSSSNFDPTVALQFKRFGSSVQFQSVPLELRWSFSFRFEVAATGYHSAVGTQPNT